MKTILATLTLFLLVHAMHAQPWSVNPQDFEFSMNITGKVKLDSVFTYQANTWLGAFVGSECRGYAQASEVQPNGMFFFLTIYSNNQSGDSIRFEYMDELSQSHSFSQKVIFNSDAIYGNPDDPYLWMNPAEYASTDFLAFNADHQTGQTTIDSQNKTINLFINSWGNLNQVTSSFLVPAGARVFVGSQEQTSGVSVNSFQTSVIYTVLGTDGSSTDWTVSITMLFSVETLESANIRVFPNPAEDFVFIDRTNISAEKCTAEVYSLTGKRLGIQMLNENQNSLNVSDLEKGCYLLILRDDKNSYCGKIIKN